MHVRRVPFLEDRKHVSFTKHTQQTILHINTARIVS